MRCAVPRRVSRPYLARRYAYVTLVPLFCSLKGNAVLMFKPSGFTTATCVAIYILQTYMQIKEGCIIMVARQSSEINKLLKLHVFLCHGYEQCNLFLFLPHTYHELRNTISFEFSSPMFNNSTKLPMQHLLHLIDILQQF